jgi:hypothetical protein
MTRSSAQSKAFIQQSSAPLEQGETVDIWWRYEHHKFMLCVGMETGFPDSLMVSSLPQAPEK